MLKKITSPIAVAALLLAAGATAIPTAIGMGATDSATRNDFLLQATGFFTLGAVATVFLYIFKIWRWKHFAQITVPGRWWLFLILNSATAALIPGAWGHLKFITTLFPELLNSETMGVAFLGAVSLTLFAFIITNLLFFAAQPHTLLPAKMSLRYSGSSKELNAWRVVFAPMLFADIVFLSICVNTGAVTGIIAAVVYAYVLFALHAGKIAWKEERKNGK